MLSQFCVRSENVKQQSEKKSERAMLSQFCVCSENEKQQTEKTERPCCRSFVFVLKVRSNKLQRPRGPCCRSFVFVLKMRSKKTEKTERTMLSQFCDPF